VMVVYSDADSGKNYDITKAFSVSGTASNGVTIALDPKGSVPFGEGAALENIPVTPTFTEPGDAIEPLSAGKTMQVGVKSIPGLTYTLLRAETPSGAKDGTPVASEMAKGTRTKLTDPMESGRPDSAFYVIEVER